MSNNSSQHSNEKKVTYATLDSFMEPDVEPVPFAAGEGSNIDEKEVEMTQQRRRSDSMASVTSVISDVGKEVAPKEEKIPLQIGMNILVLLFFLGLTTGVVNGCAQWANKAISVSQSKVIESSVAGPFCFMLTTGAFAGLSAYIIKKGGLVATIGSGMPESKALLVTDFHHSEFPSIVSFKILVVRLFSLVTAVGSGLSIGIAAPLVHVSICTAYTLMNIIPDFGEFLENHAIRKQIFAAAAAVGMTTVFNAPIGGLLLSIELTNTFYLVSNYWRSFMVATVGAIMYNVFLIARSEEGRIFQVTYDENPFLRWEFVLYAILGVIGGLLALLYLRLHQTFTLFIKPYTVAYPIVTAITSGVLTALLIFAAGAHSAKGVSEAVIVHDALEDGSISTMASRPGVTPIGGLIASLIVRVFLTLIGTTMRISCGVFLPVLTLGALLGRLYGQIIADMFGSAANIYVAGYAMVGAVAFVSGTTHTISVAVIVIEQTGQFSMILPCLIGAVIACGITKSRSLSLYDQGMVNKGLESFDLLLKESGGFKYAVDVMDDHVTSVHAKCPIADLFTMLSDMKQSTFPVTSSERSYRLVGCLERRDIFLYLKSVFQEKGLYAYVRYKLPADAHYDDRLEERRQKIAQRKTMFTAQHIGASMQGILSMKPHEYDENGNPVTRFKGMFGILNRHSKDNFSPRTCTADELDAASFDGSYHSEDSNFAEHTVGTHYSAPVANPLLFTPEAQSTNVEFFTPTESQTVHPFRLDNPENFEEKPATLQKNESNSPLGDIQQMTDGFVRDIKRRVASFPRLGLQKTDAASVLGMNSFDQAQVDVVLETVIDLTKEPLLPINGFPFTAHRYTTMDQLYVLFEMVKVNVVFVVTNTKRLEGMISKYNLMKNLKNKVK